MTPAQFRSLHDAEDAIVIRPALPPLRGKVVREARAAGRTATRSAHKLLHGLVALRTVGKKN
ncbi:MAG: hypothetical protein IT538_14350 [Variibacter sp.]|nr:hypothetical protein [Variibacter sp.]